MNAKTNKSNNATATASGKPNANDPHVIAAGNVRTATARAGESLRDALLTAARFGEFAVVHLTSAGYSEGSAKTLRSEWNRGALLASLLGVTAAADFITAAYRDAKGSEPYRATLDAMREVLNRGKEADVKRATPAQVRKLVKGAAEAATDKRKRIAEVRAKAKGPTGQQVATNGAAIIALAASKDWQAGAAQIRTLSSQMHGWAVPEGMEAQARELLARLADCAEACQPFLRRVAKSR